MHMPCDNILLKTIKHQGSVSGTSPSRSFGYHLDFSTPWIAVAIHAGHRVRPELVDRMALLPGQRMVEEDTGTDFMIQDQVNAVWALESRAVYDLNRPPDAALPLVPEKFWGTRVYNRQPTPEMNRKSLENYHAFYRFMGTLVTHLLDQFGYCIVYDIHSYNLTRQRANGIEFPPVFNLGTAGLDRSKWKQHIESWIQNLGTISLPGIKTSVAENKVFFGKGEFCSRLCSWDPRILVLPTEVSKVYMDEVNGAIYPDIIKAVKTGLSMAIRSHQF